MSARRPIAGLPSPARSTPTTPVPPTPRCTSMPQSVELLRHQIGGAVFLQAEFGVGMDVVADRGQFGVEAADVLDRIAVGHVGYLGTSGMLIKCAESHGRH